MMLGRLATWLRLLGADVAYRTGISDDDLLRLAEAEDRLVLTRDRGIMKAETGVTRFFIRHDRLGDQLRQVAGEYDLTVFCPFSRCLRCNVPVVEVDKEAVRDRLWPYVYRTQERITECPSCHRLFWDATHPERAMADLARMLGEEFVRSLR